MVLQACSGGSHKIQVKSAHAIKIAAKKQVSGKSCQMILALPLALAIFKQVQH